MLIKIYWKIINNFFLGNKLNDYQNLLIKLKKEKFKFLTFSDIYNLKIKAKKIPNKFIFLRHDLDSDPDTMLKMIQIENKLNIKSTVYIRFSTLNSKLLDFMIKNNFEIGYHYEEISSYANKNGIRSKSHLVKCLPAIRANFLINLKKFENIVQKKVIALASHGDFINRKLKIDNNNILTSHKFRKSFNICGESYDKWLIDLFDIYITDKSLPIRFHPFSVEEAINKYSKIYFVSHPNNWNSNFFLNLLLMTKRLLSEIKWNLNYFRKKII